MNTAEEFFKKANALRGEIIACNCIMDIYATQVIAQYFCSRNGISDKEKSLEIISLIHNVRDSKYKLGLLTKIYSKNSRFKKDFPRLIKDIEISTKIRNNLAHGIIKTPEQFKNVKHIDFVSLENISEMTESTKRYAITELELEVSRLGSTISILDSLRNWLIEPY